MVSENRSKPFWQTLRFILSSLMVLTFYLENLMTKGEGVSGVLFAFNTTLIPMFVFIAGILSQGMDRKAIYQAFLPAIITCTAFQLINTIPVIIRGDFSWGNFFRFPLDGVWFILATPIWQWVSSKHAEIIGHPFITFLILLIIGFIGLYWLQPYTSFALILGYFPVFFVGHHLTAAQIQTWRAKNPLLPMMIFVIAIGITIIVFTQLPLEQDLMALYNTSLLNAGATYLIFMLLNALYGAFAVYFVRYIDFFGTIAPRSLGIYLIHPILCVIALYFLQQNALVLNLPTAFFLTFLTILTAAGLASIPPFNWLLAPKLPWRKS